MKSRHLHITMLGLAFLLTFCPADAVAQFAGFSITAPPPGAVLATGQTVTVTWTGGDPSNPVNVVLIDTNPFSVTGGFGVVPNNGSLTVTLPPTSQLKCAHLYQFYVENTNPRTNWTYGPAFMMVCGEQTIGGVLTANAFIGDGSGLTGVGKITGVTAGSGLAGGGPSGNVSLAVDSTVARTNASNTFSGNQAVNGTMSATSLLGGGSALTGLTAANISPGTAAINISGNAASATNAANAANLGGVAAGSYARLDVGNSFSGTQNVNGSLDANTVTVGGGNPITKHLSATFSLGFPALKPGTCQYTDASFIGASDGDTVVLGVPNSMMIAAGIPSYSAWVFAANGIKFRACNLDPNNPQKAGVSGTVRVDVWKH